MGLTMDEIKPVQKQFVQEYMMTSPYDQYVNGCGVSSLSTKQDHEGIEINLREGESLDDLCLSVFLKKSPPKDLELPAEYEGVKVFYEVVGEVLPY